MKKKIILSALIIVGCCIGFFGTSALVKSCAEYNARENAKAAERRAEHEALILTEAEIKIWTQIYSDAIRRGVWYPARAANEAIFELRKITGGKND